MTSLLLGLVTMATIVGNVFVMVAIVVERHLRVNVANYLIASLAVADLLVAALVMPLAAVNDVTRGWPLGRQLCDAWVSFDVLCCTSSILHLVAISLDRYWAVTRVDYIHNRSAVPALTHFFRGNDITSRLNAFTRSCLFNATAVAAQCHSQQTNSDSLARRHHQVRNV